MCRLFGMLSVETSNARKFLLEDSCSLYVQSKVDQKHLQSDGWGIGFYTGGIAQVIKSEKPVYLEYERFSSAVQTADSRLILAHIRRASNPRGLPRNELISPENSQPFAYENYLFGHNGTICIPDEVRRCLGEWKRIVKGVNDSEVYFWYIIKEMESGATFEEAIENFQRTLSGLWQKNHEKYPDKDSPYIVLNVIFSDGERLYAYCKYDKKDEAARSLCFKDQPAPQMSYLLEPTRLVVTSERTNREDRWRPLQSGQLLTGKVSGKTVNVNLQEI